MDMCIWLKAKGLNDTYLLNDHFDYIDLFD
jgi:hypothetical protein